MDYFRKYLGPSQGDLQPTGADTVSIINELMSSIINAWETGVYFHFNPIQIQYNNTGFTVNTRLGLLLRLRPNTCSPLIEYYRN